LISCLTYNYFVKTFRTGLSSLAHPAALAAIALVLLNDHVFKRYFPSDLTGKLSDFAGLLFFPLLLSAFIGLFEHRPRRAACWGFALTALVFAAIKLLPSAAGWASAVLGWLLGGNVRITPDPTDLAALIMLLPAWHLWRIAPHRQYDRRLVYAALVAGTLASVATSPCMPPTLITRLAQADGLIYAWGGGLVYQSDDGGLTWTDAKTLPEALKTELQTTATLPATACENANSRRCYRVGVKELAVELSGDGGKTWRLDWRIPPGRLAFMNRSRSGILSCEREVIGGPFDLLIGLHDTVVVAMGNEGVLVGSAGSWQRIEVGRTSGPTPFSASGPTAALGVVLWEALACVLIGYLYWIGLTVWAARAATRVRHAFWVFAPLLALLLAFLANVFLFLNSSMMNRVAPLLFFGGFGLEVLLLPVLTWWLASRQVTRPGAFRQAGISAFGWSLVFILALGIPFIAWGIGFPPFYWMAFVIALAAGFWTGRKGTRSVGRQVKAAMLLRSVAENDGPVENNTN
jgi:hypothetical protein